MEVGGGAGDWLQVAEVATISKFELQKAECFHQIGYYFQIIEQRVTLFAIPKIMWQRLTMVVTSFFSYLNISDLQN